MVIADTDAFQTRARADERRTARDWTGALELYLEAASALDAPDADLCLKIARCYERSGDPDAACDWLVRLVDAPDSTFTHWTSAAALLARLTRDRAAPARRTVRLALTGSFTTVQLGALLRLAALREGIHLVLFEGAYGQYLQDLLQPGSALYAFQPSHVLIAADEHALQLPAFSDAPDRAIAAEVERWTSLWSAVANAGAAQVIQLNFVPPCDVALGHLSTRQPGSRDSMIRRLNRDLGAAAGNQVLIVDCERLASTFGTRRWLDPRTWFLAKQPVSFEALPLLAQHTAAVLAGSVGLSKKCVVLDLDNTLWGGIIGEDGLAGITLGAGPQGEAFVAFQEYLLQLKEKGILLAVVSKNNDADARRVFIEHPDMRIRLDDLAAFACNWNDKAVNVRQIATDLNIGLDALVLVDDNPAETALVRRLVPEVDVLTLPSDPSQYTRAMSDYPRLETSSLSAEDHRRTQQYRARAEAASLASGSGGLEEFFRELHMQAIVAPFDELHLPRIAQLINKTNQFNLTARGYQPEQLRAFMSDPNAVHLYLKLRDRFADHGLVSVLLARRDGDTLDIDTWLMSCRVIGRTVEDKMLARLCEIATARGCGRIRGTFIPTGRNDLVRDLYDRFQFTRVDERQGTTVWEYDVTRQGSIQSANVDDWIDTANRA